MKNIFFLTFQVLRIFSMLSISIIPVSDEGNTHLYKMIQNNNHIKKKEKRKKRYEIALKDREGGTTNKFQSISSSYFFLSL